MNDDFNAVAQWLAANDFHLILKKRYKLILLGKALLMTNFV